MDLGKKIGVLRSGSICVQTVTILFIIGLLIALLHCLTVSFRDEIARAVMLIIVVFLLGVAIASFIKRSRQLHCFEKGVYCLGLFANKRLLYEEIESIGYSVTHHYTNGSYDATYYRLRLNREGEFVLVGNMHEQNIADLTAHISNKVADKMFVRFVSGEIVPWAASLYFEPTGLRYGSKTIPYREIAAEGEGLSAGKYFINYYGGTITGSVSENNFLPGWQVLKRILSQPQREVETTSEEISEPMTSPEPTADANNKLLAVPETTTNLPIASGDKKERLTGYRFSLDGYAATRQWGLLALGLFMLFGAVHQKSAVISLLLLLAGVILLIFSLSGFLDNSQLRVYENGIEQRRWGSSKKLLFTQVVAFDYNHNSLVITPDPQSQQQSIVFLFESDERDIKWRANLDRLKQMLSKVSKRQATKSAEILCGQCGQKFAVVVEVALTGEISVSDQRKCPHCGFASDIE